jgi:site-specific recombinase XerD
MAATVILRGRLRQSTYRTLIGLLAVTGMRVGEAIRLDRDDVDLAHGVLTVRHTKFGKSRELPVHPSTVKALRDYARARDRLCSEPTTSAVLVSQAGTRLLYCAVHATFKQLRDHAGLRPRSVTCRPRIHDFRHRFAVQTLLDWYRSGVDVQPLMPLLSTYLGHTQAERQLLVSGRSAGAARARRRPPSTDRRTAVMSALAPTLQAWFTDRLIAQRNVSPHTIRAYRDTLRLLLDYAQQKLGRQPCRRHRRARRAADRGLPRPPRT